MGRGVDWHRRTEAAWKGYSNAGCRMKALTSAYDPRPLLHFDLFSFPPVLGDESIGGVNGLNSAFWPRANDSVVYLWRALDMIGPVIMPEDWASTDLHARSVAWSDLPVQPHTNTIADQILLRSLHQGRNFYNLKQSPSRYDDHCTLFRYMEIYKQKSSAVAAQVAAATRLSRAYAWLVDELINSKIRSIGVLAKGGEPCTIHAHEWSGTNGRLEVMFTGGFARTANFLAPPGFRYVFVDTAKLKARLAGVAKTEMVIDSVDILRLPPYLRYAVQLAISENWLAGGAEDTSTVRENLVEKRWADALPGIKMSKKAQDAIVHLTGIPDVAAVNRAVEQANAKSAGKNRVTGKTA